MRVVSDRLHMNTGECISFAGAFDTPPPPRIADDHPAIQSMRALSERYYLAPEGPVTQSWHVNGKSVSERPKKPWIDEEDE